MRALDEALSGRVLAASQLYLAASALLLVVAWLVAGVENRDCLDARSSGAGVGLTAWTFVQAGGFALHLLCAPWLWRRSLCVCGLGTLALHAFGAAWGALGYALQTAARGACASRTPTMEFCLGVVIASCTFQCGVTLLWGGLFAWELRARSTATPVTDVPPAAQLHARREAAQRCVSLCTAPADGSALHLPFQMRECPICLTEFGRDLEAADTGGVGTLSCGHAFHGRCVVSALVLKNRCPCCNREPQPVATHRFF